MFRFSPVLLFLLVLSLAVQGQDIPGQWQGTLHTPAPFRIVLKVSQDEGAKLRASFISPDNDPDYLPVTNISIADGVVRFSVAMIEGS